MFLNSLRLAAALLALAPLNPPGARAAIADYEFQLVENQLRKGQTIAAVKLVHKRDGKAVSDAVIFATRLDMAPDDMESMTANIEPAPSSEPGVYRFKLDLTDEGRWRISLAAKIQGEEGTLQGRLILKAMP